MSTAPKFGARPPLTGAGGSVPPGGTEGCRSEEDHVPGRDHGSCLLRIPQCAKCECSRSGRRPSCRAGAATTVIAAEAGAHRMYAEDRLHRPRRDGCVSSGADKRATQRFVVSRDRAHPLEGFVRIIECRSSLDRGVPAVHLEAALVATGDITSTPIRKAWPGLYFGVMPSRWRRGGHRPRVLSPGPQAALSERQRPEDRSQRRSPWPSNPCRTPAESTG